MDKDMSPSASGMSSSVPPPPPSSPNYLSFAADSSNIRSFSKNFASTYQSLFPPKSPLQNLDVIDDSVATEHRLYQARLIIEYRELRDRYDLCIRRLRDLKMEAHSLRQENAELRLANTELLKFLSSQATIQGFHVPDPGSPNLSFPLNDFNTKLIIGGGAPGGHGGEEPVSYDASPTSVMENNQFQRTNNSERISVPKSISVRSSGCMKLNRSGLSTSSSTPCSSTSRPQIPSQLISGPQRVYVPAGGDCGGTGKSAEEEAIELEVYNQGTLKTEICNKWQETGTCPYGSHCRFAHGLNELRPVIRHRRYKTEICRMVINGDTCPYGHRCHFRHSLNEQDK